MPSLFNRSRSCSPKKVNYLVYKNYKKDIVIQKKRKLLSCFEITNEKGEEKSFNLEFNNRKKKVKESKRTINRKIKE